MTCHDAERFPAPAQEAARRSARTCRARPPAAVSSTIALAAVLAFSAAPRTAEAGLCQTLGHPNQCVTSADVKNNNLRAKDQKDEPGADFEQFATFGIGMNLTTAWADAQSIVLSHPASGLVTCLATGTLEWTTSVLAQVGWSKAAGDVAPAVFTWGDISNSYFAGRALPAATVHTFQVRGAGETTFRLKARITSGNAGDARYWRQAATCTYYPTRY